MRSETIDWPVPRGETCHSAIVDVQQKGLREINSREEWTAPD